MDEPDEWSNQIALGKNPPDIHVFPEFGRPHILSIYCWCDPEPDTEEPRVKIHHVEQ